ncbi:FAD-dependent oxidoreductase [Saccharibacillus sp. CPCC 101409]|uniref:FAD-dependent oxidoreductase n=1 Tax=Saccharibacillus sp. CPCC 101409 TaxID=3058041 RepID=UPI002672C8FC|nr:FAD-dependent oxidoreductase [Saccharibacillus sp. CPCC 101409]MDO3412894.1 FAD-dependent oxidoreductase [Saccharibacillus sp. CPCC 101409]
MQEWQTDIAVIGGGTGGVAAALAAAKEGYRVVVTEETDWPGGQLTSQAVPPDEHRWIESSGATASYLEFRERVRRYYRDNYPLTDAAASNPTLNPGGGWVSRLAHEPKVALRVLQDMLAPYLHSGRIRLLTGAAAISAETEGDRVLSVTVGAEARKRVRITADYFLDGTDCGDLLELTGTEYVTGAESRADTGEPHALEQADPLDMQSITWVGAVDYIEGGDFTIPRPAAYDFWKTFVPDFSEFPILSWYATDSNDTTKTKEFTLFPVPEGTTPLWTYRRIVNPGIFRIPLFDGPATLLNWAQNDYYTLPIIGPGVTAGERLDRLEESRQLTLSLVYWLQTEAPRPDGGAGWPGIRLRGDLLGTEDGLAKAPYIRESRRIKALYTVTEHDVSRELRGERGIKRYEDSVGVGSYSLDLHPTTVSQRTFYIPNYPYEIPLGSLIPERVVNLLPACKNIGTTQIANGCYRLHPTEWNIGESAGLLAAYSLRAGVSPRGVHDGPEHRGAYLALLERCGVQRHWPEGTEDEL